MSNYGELWPCYRLLWCDVFGLSTFAASTKRDVSFIGPSLFIGIIVAFLAGAGALVFNIPGLSRLSNNDSRCENTTV